MARISILYSSSNLNIKLMNETPDATGYEQATPLISVKYEGDNKVEVDTDVGMSRPRTVDMKRFDSAVERVLNKDETSDNIINDIQELSLKEPSSSDINKRNRSKSVSKISRPVTTLMNGSAIPEDGDETTFAVNNPTPSIGYRSTSKFLKKKISLADSTYSNELGDVSSTEEEAAIVIQRFWRYYHIKAHYSVIMGNVRRRSEQKSKEEEVVNLVSTAKESFYTTDREEFIIPSSPSPNNPSPLKDSLEASHQSTSLSIHTNQGYLVHVGSMIIHEADSLPSPSPLSPTTSVFNDSDQEDIQKRIKSKCINEFNLDCNKGMRNLIANKVTENDPYKIALFLKSETRLSKTRIGEYLGYGEELHNHVLHCFVDLFDFIDMEFDVALRRLLRAFRLPGEAQKIDRIVGEFARRYCANNPHIFANNDTSYVLAYSLIMLNTDAHNPNVRNKMTLRDFIRNNRGIDNKKSLPDEFLARLYTNIVRNEIRMNDHDNMFSIKEICEQVSGKFDNIVAPHRRYIGEFQFHQIQEYGKPNNYKGERVLFLFNDQLLITKPKIPQTKAESASTTSGESVEQDQKSKPATGRYLFRYLFNLVQMDIIDKPDTQWHKNYVELINPNGKLIGMSFLSTTEKDAFLNAMKEYLQEVTDLEDDKLSRLIMSTPTRQEACKTLLEKTYQFSSSLGKKEHRFSKFKSLRYARAVLTAQSTILTGKKKTNMPKDLYAELKSIERLLQEFPANRIMLGVPSKCPDTTPQGSADRTTSFVKSNSTTDFLQVDSEGSSENMNTSLGRRARRASLAPSVNLSRAASIRSQKSTEFTFD